MAATVGEIIARNREAYNMARGGTAGIGGPAGSVPIGDRPGTTPGSGGARRWDTPAGRAHVFALAAFGVLVFLHVAAEHRFAAE